MYLYSSGECGRPLPAVQHLNLRIRTCKIEEDGPKIDLKCILTFCA